MTTETRGLGLTDTPEWLEESNALFDRTLARRLAELHAEQVGEGLTFGVFARAVPGYLAQFKVVPERFFWTDGISCVVTCPCETGTEVRLLQVGALEGCPGCGRVYVWTGRGVRAAQGEPD